MSGRIVNVRPKPGFVVDSAGGIMPMSSVRDGALTNFMTGRGTSVDRSAHNWWSRSYFMPEQVEAAYLASWLMRKVVDVPAEDQTREGRDWDADSADIEKIEAEEKRLSYWQVVRAALTNGRLGGGAIFINTGDNPAAPLPENVSLGQVVKLVPLHRTHLTLGGMDDDLLSPYYGEPVHFRVNTPQRPLIHASRLVIFKGEPVPGISFSTWEDRFWGQSIVQVVDKAVKDATTATDGFASLIDEAKVDVFTMPGMYETLGQPGGEAKFMAALQATATGKSIHRMLALGEGETWETRELTWAGMPDMIKTYLAVVAGAADIPATRLLGKSPDGMNATGEGDLTNYYDGIASRQESDLRPALEHLDKVMLPSAGVDPKLPWNFSPLRVLTPQQMAEVENKEAQSLQIYVNSGLWPDSVLSEVFTNKFVESQRFPGLQEAMKKAVAEGFDPDEPDPSELVPIPTQEGGDPSTGGQANLPEKPGNARK